MLKNIFAPLSPDFHIGIKGMDFRSSFHIFRIIISVISSGNDAKYTVGTKCSCAKHTKATFKSRRLVPDSLSILKGHNEIMNRDFNTEKKTHFIIYTHLLTI